MLQVPTVDEILDKILLDYKNVADKNGHLIDVSKGSSTYIDSAVLASAIQGVYYRMKWTEQQMLPNLGSTSAEYLSGWASIFDLEVIEGESESDKLTRIVERIQEPPSCGTAPDWRRWVKPITVAKQNSSGAEWTEQIHLVKCVESAVNAGSVSIVVVSRFEDFPEYVPGLTYEVGDMVRNNNRLQLKTPISWSDRCCSPQMEEAVRIVGETNRVLGLWNHFYHGAIPDSFDVDVLVPAGVDTDAIKIAITNLVMAKGIGETVYYSDIFSVVYAFGVRVFVVSPAVDFVVGRTSKAIPNDINVHV